MRVISFLLIAVLLGAVGWGIHWTLSSIWDTISNSDNKLSVAIIAGFFSIIGAAMTVTLGRHFDRKKEIEAAFRERKIEIYDKFLIEIFKIFHANGSEENNGEELVIFLQEWQRTLVLWGGRNVLRTYFAWMSSLKKGHIDAGTIFLMDDFFRALRKDIGQSSFGLEKGAFSHLLLRHADLFLSESKKNPKITLDELAEMEVKLGLEPKH